MTMHDRIRVFFCQYADTTNRNAQSLNAREIARRLDPARYQCTFFYQHEVDSRLRDLDHVRLYRVTPRLGTGHMLAETIAHGHDIVFNLPLNRFGLAFSLLPRWARRRALKVQWIESQLKDALACAEPKIQVVFRTVYPRLDHLVAITESVRARAQRDFGFQCETVIPVGVDPDVFAPVERPLGRPAQVLFIGHLIERKRPQLVVDAARELRSTRFVLVGERRGDFYAELERRVAELGLDNVRILAPMGQDGLARLMHESDVFLLPSLIEGLPKVVLEAAATGIPAVIFNAYDAPVVRDGVTGYQVGSYEQMMARLRQLVEDEPLRRRMGAAAIEHARSFYWQNVVERWQSVYERVVEARA
jgi:glycosyltransferase involved in cell wall biosynthesis